MKTEPEWAKVEVRLSKSGGPRYLFANTIRATADGPARRVFYTTRRKPKAGYFKLDDAHAICAGLVDRGVYSATVREL